MLSIDDFIPVTLETKKDFDQVYSKYPPVHSDYVFTTLVSWSDYAHYSYVLVDDAIIIKTRIDDTVYFRPPLGKYSKETFYDLIKLAKKEGSDRPLTMITEDAKQWIEKEYAISSFHPHPEFADYVYKSSDLATLEGSKYRKIRNRLNKFKKHFDYQVVTVSLENMDEVKRFLKRWCIWRECEDDPLLSYEKNAVMYLINGTVEYLPFYPVSVDVVISRFSLPYWAHPGKAFQEIACVLRKNGLLILEMLNAEYPSWKKSLVKSQMMLKKASAHTISYHLEAYAHAYTLPQVESYLENSGFTLVRVEGRKRDWKYLIIAKKK